MIGTPSTIGRATSAPVTTAAATVRAVVMMATNSDGMPKRTTCESASTSLVVRDTRSPVPARSTVDSGRLVTRDTNCSRSCANTVSPRTNDARRAVHMSPVWTTTDTANQARGGEGGQGGQGVQADDGDEGPAVLAQQHPGVRPDRGHVRHGQRAAG